jgi:hypothetical protein
LPHALVDAAGHWSDGSATEPPPGLCCPENSHTCLPAIQDDFWLPSSYLHLSTHPVVPAEEPAGESLTGLLEAAGMLSLMPGLTPRCTVGGQRGGGRGSFYSYRQATANDWQRLLREGLSRRCFDSKGQPEYDLLTGARESTDAHSSRYPFNCLVLRISLLNSECLVIPFFSSRYTLIILMIRSPV